MQSSVIVLHGCGGSPEGNWFPWLKKELATSGTSCIVPRLPAPESQNLASWQAAFYVQFPGGLQPKDILIGHSTGSLLAMRLLERQRTPITAAYLVCPFAEDLGGPFDPYNRSFYAAPFDWDKIASGALSTTIYAGTNDPYVPQEKTQKVADAIGVPVTWIKNGQHLNKEAGYSMFLPLLESVRQQLAAHA